MFSLRKGHATNTTTTTTTSSAVPKGLISASHFMIWASSAIVVGITGYFLKNYRHDQHLIFQMVIAALTLFFWIPSFLAPMMRFYKFYYALPNLVFSYLWLTSFIFAAQDYNESSCRLNAPTGGSCNLKLTSEAFIFLAFFFSLLAYLLETRAAKREAVLAAGPVHPEKEVRPTGATAA